MSEIKDIGSAGNMEAQIKAAIGVHGLWKGRISSAIDEGKSEFDPAVVEKNGNCDFGKWLNALPADQKSDDYDAVYKLHAEFHIEAARILRLAVSGQKEDAQKATSITSDYAKLTGSLTKAMMAWIGNSK